MAIDSSMFAAAIPAASYALGDRISMAIVRGPAVVRSGYGAAYLKRLFTIADSNSINGAFKVTVKNSNWVDSMSNPAPAVTETALSSQGTAIQQGQDIELYPNSGWEVVVECISPITTNAATDIVAIIDVDYPRVAGVEDPKKVQGFPVTIDGRYTITDTVAGNVLSMNWTTFNVDFLKAGSKYLLVEAGFRGSSSADIGFIAISGASSQAGLERIIPCRANTQAGMRFPIDYSTPLVKGPMNIAFAALTTSAGTPNTYAYFDFVKKAM